MYKSFCHVLILFPWYQILFSKEFCTVWVKIITRNDEERINEVRNEKLDFSLLFLVCFLPSGWTFSLKIGHESKLKNISSEDCFSHFYKF